MGPTTIQINKAIRKKAGFPQRIDILNNLPRHGVQKIADDIGVNKSYISRVFNGHISPTGALAKSILKYGELMAAVYLFNQHYCRVIPSIDPLAITLTE